MPICFAARMPRTTIHAKAQLPKALIWLNSGAVSAPNCARCRPGIGFASLYTCIDLLEAIGRRGSISQGAKDVDLSYKAAWDAVDAMNNLAEQPLLIRAIGGQHGGGSYLTAHGREIIRLYRLLQSGYHRLLTQMQAQVHDVDC
jgi:molybdate transport repressor ModE-like protein